MMEGKSIQKHVDPSLRTVKAGGFMGWMLFHGPTNAETGQPINPGSPLLRGEKVEHLKVLRQEEVVLQDIRRRIMTHFDPVGEGKVRVYLIGSSAQAELRGEGKKGSDLDILVQEATQEELLSEEFIGLLEEEYDVEIASKSVATDHIYLILRKKGSDEVLAEIAVCYFFKDGEKNALTMVETLQRLACYMTAIEIFEDGYQAVSAYKDALRAMQEDPSVALPFAPGLGDISLVNMTGVLRYPRELTRNDYFTVLLDTLNEIRDWWLRFKSVVPSLEEATAISNVVGTIRKGFEEANKAGMAEIYFGLLIHSGTLHTLFPVAWAGTCHRLFGPEDKPAESVFGYLRENGFSLGNLCKAMQLLMDEKIVQNIAKLEIEDLSEDWHISYLENLAILSALQNQLFPMSIIIPGDTREILRGDMLSTSRPPQTFRGSKKAEERAKYIFWYIIGPYVESFAYAEALTRDGYLVAAGKLVGIEPPSSTFDRVGLMYERVNIHLIYKLACGEFKDLCKQAMFWNQEFAQFPFGIPRMLQGRRLTELERALWAKKARFKAFLIQNLGIFRILGLIDDFIEKAMVEVHNRIGHEYRYVFD